MVGCKNCGTFLRFDVSIQRMRCERCGETYRVEDVKEVWVSEANENKSEEEKKAGMEVFVFKCSECGGILYGGGDSIGGFCGFCGALAEMDGRLTMVKRPKKIIPFRKTKEECKEIFKKLTFRVPFFVEEYKDEAHRESFHPVYMPYSFLSAKRKEECKGVGPFLAEGCVDFQPGYLPGFYYDKLPEEEEITDAGEATGTESSASKALCPVWVMSYQAGGRVAQAAVNGQTGKMKADFPIEINKLLLWSLLLVFPLYFYLEHVIAVMPAAFLLLCSICGVISAFLLYGQVKKIRQHEGIKTAEDGEKKRKKKKGKFRESEAFLVWEYCVLLGLFFSGMVCLVLAFWYSFAWRLAVILFFLAEAFLIFCFAGRMAWGRDIMRTKEVFIQGLVPVRLSAAAILVGIPIVFFRLTEDFWYYGDCLVILCCIVTEVFVFVRNHNYLATRRADSAAKKGGDGIG